jgi:hypothetical protein
MGSRDMRWGAGGCGAGSGSSGYLLDCGISGVVRE